MSLLLEMFTYPFILRAFIVGILVSLCAALLGVPLVLKRYSMIGDGLSHVSFGALSIALACGWAPLPVSIPVVGMGGVSSAEDVVEMMLAGASAVEVGAANLVNPYACRDIIRELPAVMEKYKIENLKDIIGGAK